MTRGSLLFDSPHIGFLVALRRWSKWSVLSAVLLVACGQEVEIDIVIPPTPFVRVDQLRVVSIPILPSELGLACRTFTMEAERPGDIDETLIATDTGFQEICTYGTSAVPDVADGLRAHLAIASSARGTIYLTGCSTRDWNENSSPLRIDMTTTQAYIDDFFNAPLPTCTPDQKCGGALCP